MEEPSKPYMRVLGKRKPGKGLQYADGLLKLVVALRGNKPFIPRGVYRFHSHEEKDEWTLKMLTRPSNPGRQL